MHGAAGGVGTAAVQIGRAAGARVTATVRREELRAAGRGSSAPGRSRPEGFGEHGPYDVILELVGAGNLEEQPRLARAARADRRDRRGRQRPRRRRSTCSALMQKHARIHGSTLRARPLEEKALAARLVERELLPHFESGALTVPVAATFPLDEAEQAYDRFAAGGKLGKIVLLP